VQALSIGCRLEAESSAGIDRRLHLHRPARSHLARPPPRKYRAHHCRAPLINEFTAGAYFIIP
jgi:hypothetical protein